MSAVWRCSVCRKTKALSGPHLDGKTTVRSDCWPCAKKQLFVREESESVRPADCTPAQLPPAFRDAKSTSSPLQQQQQKSTQNGASTLSAASWPTPSVPMAAHNPFAKAVPGGSARQPASALSAPAPAPAAPPAAAVSKLDVASSLSPSSSVVDGAAAVWRCSVCRKTKALSGPHLNGKATVRSDCWPCAKKQLFVRDTVPCSAEARPAGGVTTAPFLYTTAAAATTTTSVGITSQAASPFGAVATASAAAGRGASSGSTAPSLERDTAASVNTFRSALSAVSAASAAGGSPLRPHDEAAAARHTGLPAGGRSPQLRMETKVGTSPPFRFVAVAGGAGNSGFADPSHTLPASTAGVGAVVSPSSASSLSTPVSAGGGVWVCSVCRKKKDLHGPHLNGKTAVRSDCWPCAKKQLFVRMLSAADCSVGSPSPSGATAAGGSNHSSHGSGSNGAALAGGVWRTHSSSSPRAGSVASGDAAAATSGTAPRVPSSQDGAPISFSSPAAPVGASVELSSELGGEQGWCVPVIPPNEAVTDFYLLAEDDDDADADAAVGGGGDDALTIGVAHRLHAAFNAQLLRAWRLRLVERVPVHCAWFGRVLYVIAEEPPLASLSSLLRSGSAAAGRQRRAAHEGTRAYEFMGRYAALLMAVESKLASSRYHRLRRLFCPSAFSFAAGCCYAMQFAAGATHTHGSGTSAATASAPASLDVSCSSLVERAGAAQRGAIAVFGPKADPTRAPTLWGRIAQSCPQAVPCIASEDQRVRAAQQLYHRARWLAMPSTMTGAAIQLAEEERLAAGAMDPLKRSSRRDSHAGETQRVQPASNVDKDVHTDPNDGGGDDDDDDGADVVLLPGTMRLEDLPLAAALAMPVKRF